MISPDVGGVQHTITSRTRSRIERVVEGQDGQQVAGADRAEGTDGVLFHLKELEPPSFTTSEIGSFGRQGRLSLAKDG